MLPIAPSCLEVPMQPMNRKVRPYAVPQPRTSYHSWVSLVSLPIAIPSFLSCSSRAWMLSSKSSLLIFFSDPPTAAVLCPPPPTALPAIMAAPPSPLPKPLTVPKRPSPSVPTVLPVVSTTPLTVPPRVSPTPTTAPRAFCTGDCGFAGSSDATSPPVAAAAMTSFLVEEGWCQPRASYGRRFRIWVWGTEAGDEVLCPERRLLGFFGARHDVEVDNAVLEHLDHGE